MKNTLIISFISIVLWSCQDDGFDPTQSFTKIYNSSSSQASYHPIDVVETGNGFLILSARQLDESDFSGAQLITLDKAGNFLAEHTLADVYVAPVGDFIQMDSVYYFFAMEESTLATVLFSTSGDLSDLNQTTVTSGSYPLAGGEGPDGDLLLLSYDPDGLQTVISSISLEGSLNQGIGYSIGAGSDVESYVINHFVDPERSAMPFFCGTLSTGQVYFNGFYNYSFSMVFSSFGGEPDGVLQGQGVNGGLTMAVPVLGSDFAVSGFQFNESFVNPHVTLNTSGIESSVDLMESSVTEFEARGGTDLAVWSYRDVRYIIVAAETQNRQVALYIYDYVMGELRGIEKIGYQNAFTPASIRVDADNGLLILGSTYVSGRFKRIFLKKMTEKELGEVIQ